MAAQIVSDTKDIQGFSERIIQNSAFWHFKNLISKCPNISEILTPYLCHIMYFSQTNK